MNKTGGGMMVHPKYLQLRVGGWGVMSHVFVRTYTLYNLISFHVFGSIFAL